MKDLIKEELVFIEKNADLLRNNYDPVIFEFKGFEEKYWCTMCFYPFCIQIDIQTKPSIHFLFTEKEGCIVIVKKIESIKFESRKMDESEEEIFKRFIKNVYERLKKEHDAWY